MRLDFQSETSWRVQLLRSLRGSQQEIPKNLGDDIYYANPGSSLGLRMHRAQTWTYNYSEVDF